MHRLLSHRSASHDGEVLSLRAVHAAVLSRLDFISPDGQCPVSNNGHERDGPADGTGSVSVVRWVLSGAVSCAQILLVARYTVLCEIHVCRCEFE